MSRTDPVKNIYLCGVEMNDLYNSLKEAYTEQNLHQISSRIIDMFREHRYDFLRAVQKVVNEFTPCNEDKIDRIFSRLIMIFHPDRLNQSLGMLEQANERGDFEMMYSMSHILNVQNLKPEHVSVSSIITEEDLAETFGWDDSADGFSYFMEEEEAGDDMDEVSDFAGRTFLSTLKRMIYGNLNVDFPIFLLEDMEEIEMADYEIEYLDGIGACRYARVVDLTNNNLTDLTDLQYLQLVERIYLSNNHISLIDSLGNLPQLQVLDISYNDVDDLSPLFELSNLSYLNVMGNRIPSWQLEQLRMKGVTVVV